MRPGLTTMTRQPATVGEPTEIYAAALEGHVDMPGARQAAADCRACDLWTRATRTVFGEGPVPARWMLVGEQPGDMEDMKGKPFVGPAGRILDEALTAGGIDREATFTTNVVKHFKWRPAPSGKRRLHERPTRAEVGTCLPWVATELALVRPEALVVLGATAAHALLSPDIRVTRDHGRVESNLAPVVIVTIHPSAVLRSGDRAARDAAFAELVADLRLAAATRPRSTRASGSPYTDQTGRA